MAYSNLKTALSNEGVTQPKLAEVLGLSLKTVSSKLNGKFPFTVPEYRKICILLPKYDRDWLFTEVKDGKGD